MHEMEIFTGGELLMEGITNGELQLVVFKLGQEEYGIPITQVQEINRLTSPTKIPNSPAFVEGVINLRGKIIPIVDLRKRFRLVEVEYSEDSRIVVVELSGNTIGVTVDSVNEVLRLPAANIEPTPTIATGIGSEYLSGVGKINDRLLILLDLNKILSSAEREQLNILDQTA